MVEGAVGPGGTWRDGGPGGTWRDGGPGGTWRDGGGGFRVEFPAGLARRFEVVRQLPGGGAEGFVFECRDRERDGRACAVKVYGAGIRPDRSVYEALQRAGLEQGSGVVRLYEVLDADGLVVEVLEWAALGSLRDLSVSGFGLDLVELVRSLWWAVSEFQRVVGGGHFDVKPANVLVRGLDPLELVLGDLGLARVVDGSVRFSARAGTIAYAPPEAGYGFARVKKTTAWDWWSVGMIVAEVALGRHPLSLPDGSLLSDGDEEHTNQLAGVERIDLGALDGRLGLLCSGLLTPDYQLRWTQDEVEEWLEGGSPPVHEGLLGGGGERVDRTVSVLFANQDYGDPVELVKTFQADWMRAQEQLFQQRDPDLVDETKALARARQIPEVEQLLDKPPPPGEIPRRMAQLLIALDPGLRVVFNSVNLTRGGLEAAALEVLDDPSGHAGVRTANRLDQIRRAGVLRVWRRAPGMEHAVEVGSMWDTEAGGLEELLRDFPSADLETDYEVVTRVAHAWLLRAVIDPGLQETMVGQAEAVSLDPRHAPQWWTNLQTDTGRVMPAVSLMLATAADAEAITARAEEATRQRKIEERSRRQRQQQETRAEQQRLARQGAFGRWAFAVLMGSIVALVLAVRWWEEFDVSNSALAMNEQLALHFQVYEGDRTNESSSAIAVLVGALVALAIGLSVGILRRETSDGLAWKLLALLCIPIVAVAGIFGIAKYHYWASQFDFRGNSRTCTRHDYNNISEIVRQNELVVSVEPRAIDSPETYCILRLDNSLALTHVQLGSWQPEVMKSVELDTDLHKIWQIDLRIFGDRLYIDLRDRMLIVDREDFHTEEVALEGWRSQGFYFYPYYSGGFATVHELDRERGNEDYGYYRGPELTSSRNEDDVLLRMQCSEFGFSLLELSGTTVWSQDC